MRPRTREGVRKALGMAELPDNDLMALLEELGDGGVVTGAPPVEGEGYTADELAEELQEAVVAESVGELLRKAREESGRSLRDAGAMVGVSHSRVRELEHSSNVEVATLARVAEALGYKVRIMLEPKRATEKGGGTLERKKSFSAEL